MTATTLSQLPLQAGSALAAAAGRAATGLGRAILWGISRYARAPLANTSVLALTVFTAMAGSNALYFQDAHHPSPFFGSPGDIEIGLPDAVTPATRKSPLTVPPIVVIDQTAATAPRTTTPAPTVAAPEPIGNTAVVALQRKLTTLGLYEGKVDGVFGPKTSGAIRRFEERAGLPAKGELTPEIIEQVARAPIVLPEAAAEPPRPLAAMPVETAAAQQPVIIVQPPAAAPAALVATTEVTGSIPPAAIGNPAAPEDSFQPLPDPAPLQLSLQAATQPAPIVQPRRDLPDSPREVLSLAVATAKNGIEALASVIENGPQLGPSTPAAASVAPVPATQSATIAPREIPVIEGPAEPLQTAAIAQQPTVQTAAIQQPMPAPLETPVVTAPIVVVTETAPVVAAPVVPAPVEEPVPVIVVADTAPAVQTPPAKPVEEMTDLELVAAIQRGLTSLGFLRGEIDGVAGEATAKAIRNFEVYYNYEVTGRVSPGLVDLLVAAGAQI